MSSVTMAFFISLYRLSYFLIFIPDGRPLLVALHNGKAVYEPWAVVHVDSVRERKGCLGSP